MSAVEVHTLILGAGPAGLTAAYFLAKEGIDVVVLEKESAPGGLMRSFRHNGFTLDIGRKELYSRIPDVDRFWNEILGADFIPYDYRVGILYNGSLIERSSRYKGVRRGMPWGLVVRCAVDRLVWWTNPTAAHVSNEREYMSRKRGRLISEIFTAGYREKFRGISLSELPPPVNGSSTHGLIRQAKDWWSSEAGTHGPMRHPRMGTGQIVEWLDRSSAHAGADIRCGTRVTRIATSGDSVSWIEARTNGVENRYRPRHVISSLPIDHLSELLRSEPSPDGRRTRRRSTVLVYLFFNEKPRFPHVYLEVSCPKLKAGRITNYSAFNGEMIPDGKTCLCVEFFCKADDPLTQMRDEEIETIALDELSGAGLVSPHRCFDRLVLRLPGVDAASDYRDWTSQSRMTMLESLKAYRSFFFANRAGTDAATFAGMKAAEAILTGDRSDFDRTTDPTRHPVCQ